MKQLLVIAYYFPPLGGVGVQRTLKFVKYLPQFGWQPVVLTVDPPASALRDDSLLAEIPPGTPVYHSPTRLLPSQLPWRLRKFIYRWFLVDGESGWFSSAVRLGSEILGNRVTHALYSTSAPYTSHRVALALHKHTGLPWIADFRDPWLGNVGQSFPTPLHLRRTAHLERQVIESANRVITATGTHRQALQARYPRLPEGHFIHMPNGFDPADFENLRPVQPESERFLIVYTGSFYHQGRSPAPFLRALQHTLRVGQIDRSQVCVRFVGNTGKALSSLVAELDLSRVVQIVGYQPHQASLGHLLAANVLLLVVNQGPGGENAIPGKLYEYLRVGKPTLALAEPGPAADLIRETEAGVVINPDDEMGIARQLVFWYQEWQAQRLPAGASPAAIKTFSRQTQTSTLANLLDEILLEREIQP